MTRAKADKPLTLEELRLMEGRPAWCIELECWGIVTVDSAGQWAGVPFLLGRWREVQFNYDIQSRGLTLYRNERRKQE